MSLELAQLNAYDFAQDHMETVVLIRDDDGYVTMLACDYDGDPARIINIYDPFEPAL